MFLLPYIVSDKQDPSLVIDISALYKHFLDAGYAALAIFYLTEAFYNKSLTPTERMYRAWFCKTFLVTWYDNKTSSDLFITDETYKDVVCCCDGLLMYMLMLRSHFPDHLLVPHFFTSDACEMAFAFVRIGRFFGRRTNVDALGLGQALEARNKNSELSIKMMNDAAVAHTRRRSVLKPAVPLPNEIHLGGQKAEPKLTKGSSIDEQKLRNAMKDGTRDCLEQCQSLKLDFSWRRPLMTRLSCPKVLVQHR